MSRNHAARQAGSSARTARSSVTSTNDFATLVHQTHLFCIGAAGAGCAGLGAAQPALVEGLRGGALALPAPTSVPATAIAPTSSATAVLALRACQ